ncbi:endonuclease domain-containing protein [Mycobacterium heckeshornense]
MRGFLCSACNLGLGSFQDSASRLQRAITYLARR